MKRKLVLSLIMIAACVVSLISSTFAFIVINRTTGVEEFDFNVNTDHGILLSLDGENFKSDITSKELKEKIASSVENFDKTLFTGVTLEQDSSNKINYVNNNPTFVKDYLNDSKNHEMVSATKNTDYISFDLWVKVEDMSDSKPSHNLRLTNKTGFDADDRTESLNNSLIAWDRDANEAVTYTSKDTVTFNPANAMRLGLVNHLTDKDEITVYEVPVKNKAKDLGSYAIEGGTGIYNPANNAMFTYYNNIHPLYPFTQAAVNGEAYDQGIHEYNYSTKVIDTFEYSNNQYNVIHLTVLIWLDGWDADYFTVLPINKIHVNLELTIEE